MTHPDVMEWDADYPHHSIDSEVVSKQLKEFFQNVPEDADQLCFIARLNGEVVGFMGIHRFREPRDHVGDVGIMVHPDHQRKGTGMELLKAGVELSSTYGFERLEADTLAENKAMRKIAEKTGFRLEGIRRKAINMHGRLQDTALYAFVR